MIYQVPGCDPIEVPDHLADDFDFVLRAVARGAACDRDGCARLGIPGGGYLDGEADDSYQYLSFPGNLVCPPEYRFADGAPARSWTITNRPDLLDVFRAADLMTDQCAEPEELDRDTIRAMVAERWPASPADLVLDFDPFEGPDPDRAHEERSPSNDN